MERVRKCGKDASRLSLIRYRYQSLYVDIAQRFPLPSLNFLHSEEARSIPLEMPSVPNFSQSALGGVLDASDSEIQWGLRKRLG